MRRYRAAGGAITVRGPGEVSGRLLNRVSAAVAGIDDRYTGALLMRRTAEMVRAAPASFGLVLAQDFDGRVAGAGCFAIGEGFVEVPYLGTLSPRTGAGTAMMAGVAQFAGARGLGVLLRPAFQADAFFHSLGFRAVAGPDRPPWLRLIGPHLLALERAASAGVETRGRIMGR